MTATHATRGKVTERIVVRWMRQNGFPGADRTRRMGFRTVLRTVEDEGDIGMAPGLLCQVKSLRPVNRMERAVGGWLLETELQRRAAGAYAALLVVRRDGTADVGEWWAWLPLYMLDNLRRPDSTHAWAETDHVPARLMVADACRLLRAAGYGTPLDPPAETSGEDA
jgi:hypothetical protein